MLKIYGDNESPCFIALSGVKEDPFLPLMITLNVSTDTLHIQLIHLLEKVKS